MRKLIVMALAIAGALFSQDISYRTIAAGSDPRGTIRILAGGVAAQGTDQYVDSAGNLWQTDAIGYSFTPSPGTISNYTGGVCTYPFAGTADPTIYKTFRYAANGTSFSYTFNVIPGTYNVKLLLMETQVNTPNTRTFDFYINSAYQGNVDTYAIAGARCKATSVSYTVTTGSALTITFTAIKSIAVVEAVEITPTGAIPPADLTSLNAYGLYVDNATLTGTATEFSDSLVSSTGTAALPGIATNIYIFHDGDVSGGSLATGAATVDGAIFDVGGTATGTTMLDSAVTSISHALVLPTNNGGSYAGDLSGGTFSSAHNTCYSSCGSNAAMDSSLAWITGQSNDPAWYDPQRNLALFDSKYLGNSYAAWNSGTTYTAGQFASLALPGWSWGLPVNFRYTAGTGCGGANPKPLVTAGWRNCWEYASLYRIRMALPDVNATPPRNTIIPVDDQSIGASGDAYPTVLWKWVRAGYAPTNPYYVGRASDGYDAGAMSVVFAVDPQSTVATAKVILTLGGKMQVGGKVEVQ